MELGKLASALHELQSGVAAASAAVLAAGGEVEGMAATVYELSQAPRDILPRGLTGTTAASEGSATRSVLLQSSHWLEWDTREVCVGDMVMVTARCADVPEQVRKSSNWVGPLPPLTAAGGHLHTSPGRVTRCGADGRSFDVRLSPPEGTVKAWGLTSSRRIRRRENDWDCKDYDWDWKALPHWAITAVITRDASAARQLRLSRVFGPHPNWGGLHRGASRPMVMVDGAGFATPGAVDQEQPDQQRGARDAAVIVCPTACEQETKCKRPDLAAVLAATKADCGPQSPGLVLAITPDSGLCEACRKLCKAAATGERTVTTLVAPASDAAELVTALGDLFSVTSLMTTAGPGDLLDISNRTIASGIAAKFHENRSWIDGRTSPGYTCFSPETQIRRRLAFASVFRGDARADVAGEIARLEPEQPDLLPEGGAEVARLEASHAKMLASQASLPELGVDTPQALLDMITDEAAELGRAKAALAAVVQANTEKAAAAAAAGAGVAQQLVALRARHRVLLPALPEPIAQAICLMAFAGDHTLPAVSSTHFPCCGAPCHAKYQVCNPSAALLFDVETNALRHTLPDASKLPCPWEETLAFKLQFVPNSDSAEWKQKRWNSNSQEWESEIGDQKFCGVQKVYETRTACSHRFERGRLPRHPGQLKWFHSNGFCNENKVGWDCCADAATYGLSPNKEGCVATAPAGEEADWAFHVDEPTSRKRKAYDFFNPDLNWAYSDLAASTTGVSFTLTNVGTVDGAEIAQLYLGFPSSAGEPRKPLQLKGFVEVAVKAGDKAAVTIPLNDRSFVTWDVASHAWKVEAGTFSVHVGSSSSSYDIHLTGGISI